MAFQSSTVQWDRVDRMSNTTSFQTSVLGADPRIRYVRVEMSSRTTCSTPQACRRRRLETSAFGLREIEIRGTAPSPASAARPSVGIVTAIAVLVFALSSRGV